MKRTVQMKNAKPPVAALGAIPPNKKTSQKKLKRYLALGRLSEKGKDQIKDQRYQSERRAQAKIEAMAAQAAN